MQGAASIGRSVAILTIHGNGPDYGGAFARRYAWPELQIRQIRRFTPAGTRIIAYGNRLMPEHADFLRGCEEVEYISSRDVPHGAWDDVWPIRNWLVRRAVREHDVIVVLDSDAFPVKAGWLERYMDLLSDAAPLVAVRRAEFGESHSDR